MSPLISIIVPIYNRQETINVCIDSILSQDYANIEIILIDDGSKDASGTICDNYKKSDKRIKVLHQQNSGVSTARNNGIKIANGEWITFVDSDDAILPNHISCMARYCDSADFVMTNRCKGFYQNGELHVESDCCKGLTDVSIDNLHNIANYLFGKHDPYNHAVYAIWDKIFRLDIIKKHDISFPNNITFGEDQIFVLHYLQFVNRFHFENVGTYMPTPIRKNIITSPHLGASLRTPEEYIIGFKKNYEAIMNIAKITNSMNAKYYAINYIAGRPMTRIIYQYLEPRNISKYPYKKLIQFIKREITPLYKKAIVDFNIIQNKQVRTDTVRLINGNIKTVIITAFLRNFVKWLYAAFQRRIILHIRKLYT